VTKVRKVTVTPVFGLPQPSIDGDDFSSKDLPFEIRPDLFLADIHGQMKDLDLTVWSSEYLSKHDVEKIQGWKYALVHYYNEGEYVHGDEELQSRELLQKIFMGLRVVRPSRIPFQYLHARVKSDGSFDPSGFSRAEMPLTVFPCDRWTPIRRKDAELLKAIAPTLLRAYQINCQPVTRAVRILEMGYVSPFPDVKQLFWITALEALFTSASYSGAQVVISRLRLFLGSKTRIYQRADFHSSIWVPSLTVKNVLWDVYVVRNRLAHGEWIPKEFLEKPGYVGGAASYADVLIEATGIVLRLALTRILKESLLETFCDKDKLDRYFSYDPATKRAPCES
jgi:hypothetical protein